MKRFKLFRQSSSTKANQAFRWFLATALASLVPIIFNFLINLIKGNNLTELIQIYLPDILLVIISVSASVIDLSTSKKSRKIWLFTSILSLVFCLLFYATIREASAEFTTYKYITPFAYAAIVFLCIHIFGGIYITWKNTPKDAPGENE